MRSYHSRSRSLEPGLSVLLARGREVSQAPLPPAFLPALHPRLRLAFRSLSVRPS